MPNQAVRVEVDWSGLQRGLAQLARNVERNADKGAEDQANVAAQTIRSRTPVRTGRLVSTVGVEPVHGGGSAVTYGGNLPYANYINKRSKAVEAAQRGAAAAFRVRMELETRRAL